MLANSGARLIVEGGKIENTRPAMHSALEEMNDQGRVRAILFVDSEPAVLDSIRRSLFQLRASWDMHFCSDYRTAREYLAEGAFDLVVSDIGGRNAQGLEFVRDVRSNWPEIIRIILTGDISDDVAIESVGIAHQFLSKPIETETFVSALKRATRMQALLSTYDVESVLSTLERVPSLPDTYRELCKILDDPDSNLGDAAAIIETDPGLTTGILRVVNSAYFGLQREIDKIAQALNYLGIDTLKSLVLSEKLFEAISVDSSCQTAIENLKSHGLECASLALRLAKEVGLPASVQGNLYMTGLIHDFGKLVLLSACGGRYLEILKSTSDEHEQAQMERERFGADHAIIGAYFFGIWGFPETMIEIIAAQHNAELRERAETLEHAVMFAALESLEGSGSSYAVDVARTQSDNPHIAKVARCLEVQH